MTLLLRVLLCLSAGGIVALGISILIAHAYARPRTYQADDAPSAPVAIVFGAGLMRDGSPTAVLKDRVATAADLFFSGKVQKLLMSGDNRYIYYNEPGAMKTYALSLGVPESAIVLDYAGRRTYDSCYRARFIFDVQQAILVTQNFHLPRSIYTCNALGVKSVGVSADRRQYQPGSYLFWSLREVPATLVAIWQVWVTRPLPVLGDPEPIFPPLQSGQNPTPNPTLESHT